MRGQTESEKELSAYFASSEKGPSTVILFSPEVYVFSVTEFRREILCLLTFISEIAGFCSLRYSGSSFSASIRSAHILDDCCALVFGLCIAQQGGHSLRFLFLYTLSPDGWLTVIASPTHFLKDIDNKRCCPIWIRPEGQGEREREREQGSLLQEAFLHKTL